MILFVILEEMMIVYAYDDAVLKRLQQVQTEMLKELNDVCQKNNIDYFLLYGSAIGAARHKGFIPWDDDVDIGMTRKDYDKLKRVFLSNNLLLVDPTDNVSFHNKIFPRVYKKGTIFATEEYIDNFHSKENEYQPIWIDIFVFDFIDDLNNANANINKSLKFHRRYVYSKYKQKFKKGECFSAFLKTLLKRLYFYFSNCFLGGPNKVYKKYLDFAKKVEKSDFLIPYDAWDSLDQYNSIVSVDDVFPIVKIKFGDLDAPMMKNYVKVLNNIYGDYMKIPPIEKRVNHPPYILDFGDGHGNRIQKFD